MSIGTRLKSARENLYLTQRDVQEKTGIRNANLSNWELDKALPSILDLRTLANLYEVTTDYLIGDVNAYADALARQEGLGFLKMLFKDDPEIRDAIVDINFDGSIGKLGDHRRLTEQNIAFIKNAIRLAYKEAVSTGQPVVEIKPKED